MFDKTTKRYYLILILLSTCATSILIAQENNSYVIIDSIIIKGVERTKPWVIEQEARIHKGDTIALQKINEKIEEITIDLNRTNLFSKVDITYQLEFTEHYLIVIEIKIEENWVLFPSIIFEIADRNFNVWWKEQNHSFSRINLGAKLFHYNITGRKDILRLQMHTGYTNKLEASYEYPYISKRYNIGMRSGVLYTQNKEVVYKTENNKSLFYKDDQKSLFSRRRFSLGFKYRPNRKWTHSLNTDYVYNKVSPAITDLNPDYFLDGATKQQFTAIVYNLEYYTKDFTSRPTKGIHLLFKVEKIGIPWIEKYNLINTIQKMSWTQSLYKKKIVYNILVQSKQGILRDKKYPFNLYEGLGYNNDLVYGYEYYVIDGLDYFTVENGLRIPLFNFNKSFIRVFKNEPKIKIKVNFDYLVNVNYGYVNDPFYKLNNELSNTHLYSLSTGFGFVINDAISIRVQGSINHKKESGIFIHSKSSF
jgi:outer membrane protein assembly factor BamA